MTLAKTLISFLLIFQITTSEHKDLIISESGFLGIEIGKTTFYEADKILRKKSFKKPEQLFTSIRFRDMPSATLMRPNYYIKIHKTKVKVKLKGYTTVDVIQINPIAGTSFSYSDIILGKTKVKDIHESNMLKWESVTSFIERDLIFITNYKGIKIGVSKRNHEHLKEETIDTFILKREENENLSATHRSFHFFYNPTQISSILLTR